MVSVYYGVSELKEAGLYRQMFQMRYEQYIVRRKWALSHRGGLELDQYDNDDAVYLASFEPDGAIRASIRMLPTTKPHLMEEIFPHLCTAPMPQGPGVYELTRFFTSPARSSLRQANLATGEIICGMFEWGLDNAVDKIISVVDTYYLPIMLEELQLAPRPLGLPEDFGGGPDCAGGGTAIAVSFNVTEQSLLNTNSARGGMDPARYNDRVAPPELYLN